MSILFVGIFHLPDFPWPMDPPSDIITMFRLVEPWVGKETRLDRDKM